jgi:hypothetical protein
MKTILEIAGYRSEIDRADLGRVLSSHKGAKVYLVPETDDEVRDQREKAAKAMEERRSYEMHIHRQSKAKKEAFFNGSQISPNVVRINARDVSWMQDDPLREYSAQRLGL